MPNFEALARNRGEIIMFFGTRARKKVNYLSTACFFMDTIKLYFSKNYENFSFLKCLLQKSVQGFQTNRVPNCIFEAFEGSKNRLNARWGLSDALQ